MRSPCTETKSSPRSPQLEKARDSNEDPMQPKKQTKKEKSGLPWWRSGWKSACQWRGRGFVPRSGRIPRAVERLGP